MWRTGAATTEPRGKVKNPQMRVGFDIGGTFTDIIVLGDDGEIVTDKVLSLLERVGEDVAACVRPLARTQQVESFVHGTTVASNAVIEGTAARAGLITTKEFRDDLEMRGQRRRTFTTLTGTGFRRWTRTRPARSSSGSWRPTSRRSRCV